MSESKMICPHCQRAPGRAHSESCPRGRVRQRALAAECKRVLRRRVLFWTKGPIAYRAPGMESAKLTYNPGIPYVGPGKHWRAGGVPRDTSAVEEFVKSIGGKA